MAIFKSFNIVDAQSPQSSDVVSNVKDIVSSGMWANGAASLAAFYTSSAQSSSNGDYYLDVYDKDPQSDNTAAVQFSVAYGHYNGSGSLGKVGVAGNRASAAIYRQLTNTLLGPNVSQFTFAGSGTNIKPKYVYAISIARQQLREKMDPGNWELHLSGSSSSIKLIDDSGATTNPQVNQGGRVFNVVSGSIASGAAVLEDGVTATNQPGGAYGLFYPDLGIIVLNGPVVDVSGSIGAVTATNTLGGNVDKFYALISGSATPTGTTDGAGGKFFKARREEVITSQHYFCRIPNKEFNFSANPTYVTGSNGSFQISSFFKNPKTFITQVGLYNSANELLAIAKLSKPLLKSYSREAIIKVKLDF